MSAEPRADSGPCTPEGVYERLVGRIGSLADASEERRRRLVLAVIWATVDRDRVLAGLGLAADLMADDPLLGASVALVRPADGDPIAILEPVTEGRLAATLARHGEGPAGEYVDAPVALDKISHAAAAAGLALSRPAEGPFGRSILVVSSPGGGPHLVLVERPAGTIGR